MVPRAPLASRRQETSFRSNQGLLGDQGHRYQASFYIRWPPNVLCDLNLIPCDLWWKLGYHHKVSRCNVMENRRQLEMWLGLWSVAMERYKCYRLGEYWRQPTHWLGDKSYAIFCVYVVMGSTTEAKRLGYTTVDMEPSKWFFFL